MGLVPNSRIRKYISSGLSVFALLGLCAVSGEVYSAIADDGSFKTAKPQQTSSKETPAASENTAAKEESTTTTKQTSEQASQSVTNQTKDESAEATEAHDFHATAYCLKGRTASGAYVKKGIIAADPKVLPLGTVVHIKAGKYTGTYTVADTGSRIRGKKVDIYVPTYKEAVSFGKQKVKIKVVNHPPRKAKTTKKSTAAKH